MIINKLNSSKKKNLLIGFLCLITYCAFSALYFGCPLLMHLNTRVGGVSCDPLFFTWLLRWWPFALWHGLNPLITHYHWAVTEYNNLARQTSIPLISLMFAPVTHLFGPLVSYNLAEIFTSAFDAFAAYLLCRYITKYNLIGFISGYFYGYSPYLIAHNSQGHLNLISVYLLPLILLTVLMRVRDEISKKRYMVVLLVLLVLQFLISKEIFASLIIASFAVYLLSIYIYRHDQILRANLYALPLNSLLPLVITLIIVSPIIYYYFAYFNGIGSVNLDPKMSIDLLNFFFPTKLMLVNTHRWIRLSSLFRTSLSEGDAYLGFPLIVLLVLFYKYYANRKLVNITVISLICMALLSMGEHVLIAGNKVFTLPWAVFFKISLNRSIMPCRYALYVSLAASIIIALWLKNSKTITKTVGKYILVLLVLIYWLPSFNPMHRTVMSKIPGYKFFTTGIYKKVIKPGENVLIIKPPDLDIFYQAITDMYFRIPVGYSGGIPTTLVTRDVIYLMRNRPDKMSITGLKAFLQKSHTNKIVVTDNEYSKWRNFLNRLGYRVSRYDDVRVYYVAT